MLIQARSVRIASHLPIAEDHRARWLASSADLADRPYSWHHGMALTISSMVAPLHGYAQAELFGLTDSLANPVAGRGPSISQVLYADGMGRMSRSLAMGIRSHRLQAHARPGTPKPISMAFMMGLEFSGITMRAGRSEDHLANPVAGRELGAQH